MARPLGKELHKDGQFEFHIINFLIVVPVEETSTQYIIENGEFLSNI